MVALQLAVLDDELLRAPTSLTVTVIEGSPATAVEFSIDATVVHTQATDSEGCLLAIAIPVPDTLLAGSHTVTAAQTGATSSSATFTLLKNPISAAAIMGADADPVAVPGALHANGHYRWVLQDLMPGGLGSYIMPMNPTSWKTPNFERVLTAKHTTAPDGQFHIIEGQEPVAEWSFEGICATQEHHDKLVAFGALKRRFYVIDHRNQAWKATFLDVSIRPRLRTNWNGTATDWVADYTVTAVAYDQTPGVPQ